MDDEGAGKEGVDNAKSARTIWVELVSTSLDPLPSSIHPVSVGNGAPDPILDSLEALSIPLVTGHNTVQS
jgi:hypothetical protein